MLPDKRRQRQIWHRVYESLPKPQPQPVRTLQLCRRRAQENLWFYRSRTQDPIYGPAYDRLADLCRQQLAMLDNIR